MRDAITALHQFGNDPLAIDARKQISSSARSHGISDAALAAAIEAGIEKAKVRPAPNMPLPLAQTTVEALMFGLRRGLSCLDDPENLDRLHRCDVDAIEQIAKRLLALGWQSDDVETLIKAWCALRGSRP